MMRTAKLGCMIGVALTIASLGARQASAEEFREPPGKLVSVNGAMMHIQCSGGRGPTVILEAGLGTAGLEWVPLQNILQHHAAVCSYDRAGLGWSSPSDAPRTVTQMTAELHELLHNAEVPGPYLLVGHSFGGYIAQMFAATFPQETAGLVLVDSSHPEQVARFRAPPINLNTVPRRGYRMMTVQVPEPPAALPVALRPLVDHLNHQEKSVMAASMELTYFSDSAAEVAAHRLTDLRAPVVVISRGRKVWTRGPKAQLKEALWLELQSELGRLSDRGAHLIAEDSGHHVHLDQPELVADSVRLVLQSVRGSACADAQREACRLKFKHAKWVSNTLAPTRLAWHQTAESAGDYVQH